VYLCFVSHPIESLKVAMGLDLQPNGLNAELAKHCQLDKQYP